MNNQVRFITLGCKVNQYETQAMRESLDRIGICDQPRGSVRGNVDFVVINTCTVTKAADRENLYWIRRAKREHPLAKIVVTGCFVEKNKSQIEALPEVDLVLNNQEKAEVASRLIQGCGTPGMQEMLTEPVDRHRYTPLSVSRSQGRSRAYVKIQDGCNHGCAFCKVVLVRGRSRSRSLCEILEEVKRLRDSGYREVVLTGIQLGAYGLDLSPSLGLVDVLEICEKVEGIERIRLSSIEPTDVQPALIEALRDISKCCPHLHIPLQSGDDEVLHMMNRRYRSAFYRDLIFRLRSNLKDFSLTLDVMAGFPSESEEMFENTVRLLEEVKPLKCHVFPYSRREGTRAASFEDVPDLVIRERVRKLISVGERIGSEVSRPYLGHTVAVLVESRKGDGALMQGITSNYLKVCFQGNSDWVGEIILVRLLALEGRVFLGKALSRST